MRVSVDHTDLMAPTRPPLRGSPLLWRVAAPNTPPPSVGGVLAQGGDNSPHNQGVTTSRCDRERVRMRGMLHPLMGVETLTYKILTNNL